jgi:hypothetical protein
MMTFKAATLHPPVAIQQGQKRFFGHADGEKADLSPQLPMS